MEEKMMERINMEIKYAVKDFNVTGHSEAHQRNMAKIHGMVDMLMLVTGKDYIITEKGVIER